MNSLYRFLALCTVLVLVPHCVFALDDSTQAEVATDYLLIDDFRQDHGDDDKSLEILWRSYTDVGAGGDSTVRFEILDSQGTEDPVLSLSGQFGSAFGYPFVGARTYLTAGNTPVDLSDYEGIRLRVRSDYNFSLQVLTANVMDYNEFSFQVTGTAEWRTLEIPFDSLEQSPHFGEQVDFSSEAIRGVGFHLTGTPGAIAPPIVIDELGFYR